MSGRNDPILSDSFIAEESLATKQFYAVTPGAASTGVALANLAGEHLTGILGLLKNKPASGEEAAVAMAGIWPGKLAGTVVQMDSVTADANGAIVRARPGDWAMGFALKGGVSGDECPIWLHPHLPTDMYFTAQDDLSSKQYYAVSVHTVAGEVDLPDSGQEIVGIVQNAPAAGVAAKVRLQGVSLFVAGTSGVSAGDVLEAESTGKLITKGNGSAGAHLCAIALAAVSADATGLCLIKSMGTTIS